MNICLFSPIKIYDDGEQTRDFVNVRDIAKANVLAAEKQELSGVFNIGSGKSITINYLATMMRDIINKDAEIIYAPPRKGEIRHSKANISLARSSFGYSPSDNVYDNLIEYIKWLKEYQEG